ncbi:FTR1 family iron permease [Staphylococcus warneri]|uniref:FTR1 family iron permease n=1 Tax=Staphylococcus warneri TaxID=1292 RepID=UPI0024815E8D|nr:FTR1 family protein [Staphylococcus warneri]MDH8822271.1 FTR1 family protein [Staphylococcus warneri]MDH8833519.1 FTR1 family protein [Staphylococcus warneri]MDH8868503.1 FTR1 family protein [Staphylococcus warneri]MDH8920318.1 FTR1 family protein [Staphylococcus warneri]
MKHYLIKIVVILMIGLSIFRFTPAHAESASMSETYVAITDAKSTIADKDKSQSDKAKALKDVKKEIKALKINNDSKEGKQVNSKLKEVEHASSDDAKADKLGELTKELIAYENQQSSKDASGKIKELQQAVDAKDAPMKKAIKDKNHSELQSLNNDLNSIWTSNETVIRNYDDGKYGQIEVNLMQLRVAIQKEPLDTDKVKSAWSTFKNSIDTVDQKQSDSDSDKYKVTQLNEELDKAIAGINDNDLDKADASLSQFVKIWPYVEGKIQTKNSSLYTKIEDKIPYYQSILDQSNKDRVKKGLQELNSEIKDTVGQGEYSFVDIMIIFLREGIEVLLIIMTLTTMTRKVKDVKGTSSVVGGALLGLILSIGLGITFIYTIGNNGVVREGMEAILGIVAVVLMYVVGIWMHRRSNAQRWNEMIQSMYNNAMSNGNLILLGTIGLISVLREGVEVIIFYMGMIGSITTKDFILGIGLAIIILIIFAFAFRFIVKLIPVRFIFRVLSILIFVMTFKMLGVSIQKLQLLGYMPQHSIEGLPTLSWIGFYPSVETIIAQVILIILILGFVLYNRKK